MILERCACCFQPLAENDGRYLSQQLGTEVFAVCERCAERIAELQATDPDGAELRVLTSTVLLAAAIPHGES
jgi:hypothetical protein